MAQDRDARPRREIVAQDRDARPRPETVARDRGARPWCETVTRDLGTLQLLEALTDTIIQCLVGHLKARQAVSRGLRCLNDDSKLAIQLRFTIYNKLKS